MKRVQKKRIETSSTGKYAHAIHFGEMLPPSHLANDAHPASDMNLSASKGLSLAKSMLLRIYKTKGS